MTNDDALLLREATGTSAVAEAPRAVASLPARFDSADVIAGGLAAQEHGHLATWDGLQAEK